MQPVRARKLGFTITDECVGCGACKKKCPWGAVLGEKKQRHAIDPTLCRECATCWYMCPKCAVEDTEGFRRKKSDKPRMPKARIDAAACAGCQNCLLNCEHSAIHLDKGIISAHCKVNADECRGCGSCMAYCPNGCIDLG